MALDTTHYIDEDDLKLRLSITDTSSDGTFESPIRAACRGIDNWCGQFFYDTGAGAVAGSEETARTFAVVSPCLAWVDPFHTTTDLVVKTDADDDGTFETTWAASDYELERFGGVEAYVIGGAAGTPFDTINAVGSYRFPTCTRRKQVLQVTARWGWATVPDNVVEATKIVATDLWKRKDTPFGITAGSVDFGGLRIGRDMLAQVESLLTTFRRGDRFGMA